MRMRGAATSSAGNSSSRVGEVAVLRHSPLPRAALLSLLAPALCSAQVRAQDRVFGGYFEESSIGYAHRNIADLQKNGVADQLTHLIYAFGNVTAAPSCAIADPSAAYRDTTVPSVSGEPYTAPLYGNFGAIRQLKALHPKLKVLISLGGQAGNMAGFENAVGTGAGRAALAESCIDLFIKGNIAPGVQAPGLFDGFNIDWEFPEAKDKRNFTALLKEFRTRLTALTKTTSKTYTLTFDSPSDPRKYANIELKKAAAQVDFLTIDGYDYAGTRNKQTNESSSLYDVPADPVISESRSIDATVRAYLKAGVPATKYTIGFPLYAVGWTGVPSTNHGLYQTVAGPAPVLLADGSGACPTQSKIDPSPGCDTVLTPGYLTYSTIETLTGANGYTAWYDSARAGATLYNPTTGTFYSYDTPAAANEKTAYIKRHKLGGAYVWALNDDDATGSLTKVIAEGLR